MAEQIIQIPENISRRVVCLYRVSTVGQVEKDDIPMQKQYCREFAQRQPGWEIIKDFPRKALISHLKENGLRSCPLTKWLFNNSEFRGTRYKEKNSL